MGNSSSKRKFLRSKRPDIYRAEYAPLSPCSDSDTISVVSILPNPAVAKRLSQAESFRAPSPHNPCTACPRRVPDNVPAVAEYSPCIPLRNSPHKADQRPQTVAVLRLKLVSPDPTNDRTNIDKPGKACRLQRSPAPVLPEKPATHTRKEDHEWMCGNQEIYQSRNNPVKSPAQRGNARRIVVGGAWMPPESEQHRLAWNVTADNDGSGRVNDRNTYALLQHVNRVIKNQLDQPLGANQAYRIELRVTRVQETGDICNPNRLRGLESRESRRDNEIYAIPSRHPRRQQRLHNPANQLAPNDQQEKFQELAREIRKYHGINGIPVRANRGTANIYEEIPGRPRNPNRRRKNCVEADPCSKRPTASRHVNQPRRKATLI